MEEFFNLKLIDSYKSHHNLSTSAFCKLCKISPSTYKRIINHDLNLPLRFAVRVVETLNITLSEFIIKK